MANTIATFYTNDPNPYPLVAIVNETQTAGTDGGGFTSGSFITRTLNTTVLSQTWLSLSSNQFTLTSGSYLIQWSAPAFGVDQHKSKLRNITDSSDVQIGSTSDSGATNPSLTSSTGNATVSITVNKTYEIQHRCQTTKNTNGLGPNAGFSVSEIYTQVVITKLG